MFKIWKTLKNVAKSSYKRRKLRNSTLNLSDIKYTLLLDDNKIWMEVRKLSISLDKYNSLIFKNAINYNNGYCITGSKGMNTFGFYQNVDIIFCNDKRKVIALYEDLMPNKMTRFHGKSSSIFVFFAGAIKYYNISYNSVLRLSREK